jgi:sodium/potassium/calcium exchanger 2
VLNFSIDVLYEGKAMISTKSNELTTSSGKFRYKYSVRAAFRSVVFVALVAGFCIYNQYSSKYNGNDEMIHRRLASPAVENESNWDGIFQVRADPTWTMILYILGILYMFLALAIVCDEYFVPALEEMSGEHQMNIPLDIAGATLMAAGGSAPELFTSLFGTFAESSVGFGTIVGSATFNVLFVIGMCSLLSKETLHLTWWPLFRDCIYYAVSLLILAIFVGVVSPEVIELWEAVILFVMYFGYVGVMATNQRLYRGLTGKELYPQDEEADSSEETFYSFKYHTTFRAGLLTLIRDPDSWLDKARIGLVSKIAGNVDDVFAFVDENGDGEITREELQKCFNKLEDQPVPESEIDQIMGDLDKNKNGRVSFVFSMSCL